MRFLRINERTTVQKAQTAANTTAPPTDVFDREWNNVTAPNKMTSTKITINVMGHFLPRRITTIHNNALAAKQLTIATGASEFRLK
jgi:hypothetical protein